MRENSAYQERYGSWAGSTGDAPDFDRCCEVVWSNERWPRSYQCQKKRGYGPGEAYCKIHDPAHIAAKNAERDAKQRAENHARNRKWGQQALGIKAIAAIRQIAAGHNDARGLAQETLREFDEKYPEKPNA